MRSLDKSLAAYLRKAKAPLREGLAVADLLERWQDIVGENAARHSRPVSMKGGTLTVECSSSTWSNELSLMSSEVLKVVNGGAGRKAVKRVLFRVGKGT